MAETLERRTLLWSPSELIEHSQGGFPIASSGEDVMTGINAGGGPNLHVSQVELLDGRFADPVVAPMTGETVVVGVRWTMSGLSGSEQYIVRFAMDGVALQSSAIAGIPGTNVPYGWIHLGWFASPGPHVVQVTVDADDTVTEVDEGDNTASLEFTSAPVAGLPETLVPPIAGEQSRDWTANAYLDVDPRAGVSIDHHGGPWHYDGHSGVDLTLSNFRQMDQGVAVIAAAAGTVAEVEDGYFDREVVNSTRPSNRVVIDHGNGWQTHYRHLAANTITVRVGDPVARGQMLGLVGSSGNTPRAHLHFQLNHHGLTVETMYTPESYWLTPIAYQGDVPARAMDSGVTNYLLAEPEVLERPVTVDTFMPGFGETVRVWSRSSHWMAGDVLLHRFYRPGGALHAELGGANATTLRFPWRVVRLDEPSWGQFPGTWQVAFFINEVEQFRHDFEVNAIGAPALRVTTGSTYVIDGRTTPIDFGSIPAGGTAPSRTFTIANIGNAPLALSALELPPGFSLSGAFPTTIAPGSSGNLMIAMDTGVVGSKFGEVRFATNSAHDPAFNFNVSGRVEGAPPTGAPLLTLPGPARSFFVGGPPQVIDGFADVADVDSSHFDGGQLVVELAGNARPGDALGIRHQGTAAELIGVNGDHVLFGGVPIGTFAPGIDGSPLTVTLNDSATLPAMRALLRNVTYANALAVASTVPRDLRFILTDDTERVSNLPVKRVVFDNYRRPVVLESEFHCQTAPHALRLRFSDAVGDSLTVQDVQVVNLTTGASVATSITYDALTDEARMTFPGFSNGVLPDGRYRATLRGLAVHNASGIPLAGDLPMDFFFLNGDADRDGRVDLDDFNILAGNFNRTGTDFSTGDFTFDGRTDLDDFNILAGRFNVGLVRSVGLTQSAASARPNLASLLELPSDDSHEEQLVPAG